jgi:hypothetical protein
MNESPRTEEATSLVGSLGSVTIKVRGGNRPGEVRVVMEGIAHYYIAYSEDPIPVGNQVLVINVRGSRQIDVEPWELGRHAEDASGPTDRK